MADRPGDGIRPSLLAGVDVPGRDAAPEQPSYSVRGGPGSVYADLADLDRASAVLDAASDRAHALSRRAAGWGLLLTAALPYAATGVRLHQHTGTLAAGLMSVGRDAEHLASGVARAARAYREAEERAATGFRDLIGITGRGGLLDVTATAATGWLLATGQPVPVGLAEHGLQGVPSAVTGLLDLASLGILARGFTVASTTAAARARDEGTRGAFSAPELLYPLLTWTGRALGMVQVGPVRPRDEVPPAETWEEVGPTRSTGAVTRLAEDLDRASSVPGAIQVTRITPDSPDAPDTVWVVTLPGTQSDGLADGEGKSIFPVDAQIYTMTGRREQENSFEEPEAVSPVESSLRLEKDCFDYRFPALSLTVLRIPLGGE